MRQTNLNMHTHSLTNRAFLDHLFLIFITFIGLFLVIMSCFYVFFTNMLLLLKLFMMIGFGCLILIHFSAKMELVTDSYSFTTKLTEFCLKLERILVAR